MSEPKYFSLKTGEQLAAIPTKAKVAVLYDNGDIEISRGARHPLRLSQLEAQLVCINHERGEDEILPNLLMGAASLSNVQYANLLRIIENNQKLRLACR